MSSSLVAGDNIKLVVDDLNRVVISGSSMTPYFIDTNELFLVPVNKQCLFAKTIRMSGALKVEGMLVEVN